MDSTTLIALGGVALAAMFWIVTQWNVIRTKNILLKFSEKSKNDATDLINRSFLKMETDLNAKIAGLETRITSRVTGSIEHSIKELDIPKLSDIPAFDYEPLLQDLTGRLDAMMQSQTSGLKAEILATVKASALSMQSAANRALQGQLGDVDELIDQYGEAIVEESISRGNPSDMIIAQLMSTGVSKKYQKEHPAAAMIIKMGKASAVQAIQSGAVPGLSNTNRTLNNTPINTETTKSSPWG